MSKTTFGLDDASRNFLAQIKSRVFSTPAHYALLAIFSVLLSASWVLGHWLDGTGFSECFWSFCAFSLLLFAGLTLVTYWLDTHQITFAETAVSKNRGGIAFAVLFLSFFITFLVNFPGSYSGDSVDSIKIALGQLPWSNTHPVMFTLLISPFVILGNALGNVAIGTALYLFIQLIFTAAVCAYACYWIKKMGAPDLVALATLAFFTFNPIIAKYATTMWKDIPFSLCMLLFILLLFEIAFSKGRRLESPTTCLRLTALAFAICLLRNNGIFAMAACALCLAIVYRRHFKRLIPLLVVIPVVLVITGPLFTACGIAPSPFRESVGIPLQQISAVTANNGSMTPEQEAKLANLVDLDQMAQRYNPISTNPVKYDPSFNNEWLDSHKPEFLKLWLEIGLENPKAYFEAWLRETEGYWNIETQDWVVTTSGITKDEGRNLLYEVAPIPIVGGNQDSNYGNMRTSSFLSPLFSIAAAVWLVVGLALVRWMRSQKELILPYVPLIALWATMLVAAPYYCEFRYMLPFHLALPIVIATAFLSPSAQSARHAYPHKTVTAAQKRGR